MVFSSAIFLLVFLPVVFISNFIAKTVKKEASNYLLLLASLIFYAWGEPYLVILMIISILINWGVGVILTKTEGKTRAFALAVGVIADLSMLGYYKYAGFFVRTVNGIIGKDLLPAVDIALPIGISFFTFQAISYIADVFRGETEASKKPVNVALYISFFPQLIAGPIVKYRDINRQIDDRSITFEGVSDGFKRFIYGLGKKVLIANVLGACVDKIYGYDITQLDAKTAWIGALCYTFQIYYDFSGYSDMAIGLGKMFGFSFLENFRYPYLSHSISEFWRRWHISLGSWFREYVYIPLGGNKKGTRRTYLNLVIVFFLTGLWHGADLSFIIWGLYHGFFSIIERLGFKKFLEKSKVISVIYTFLIVNFGWVLFRADDTLTGIRYLTRMLLPWRHADLSIDIWDYSSVRTYIIFAAAVIGMGFFDRFVPQKIKDRWSGSVTEAIYCVIILLLSLAAIAADTYNPFIYFQF
ncbi:MAG: MBOAT family protein [Lachnospiraceae bacterium]|nr:MBOAT family protein [Lachnospiraceae bacterium]